MRDGVESGGPEGNSSSRSPLFSHSACIIPTLLFFSPQREVIWDGGCSCVDTSQQQCSPISPGKTVLTGPLVTLCGALVQEQEGPYSLRQAYVGRRVGRVGPAGW